MPGALRSLDEYVGSFELTALLGRLGASFFLFGAPCCSPAPLVRVEQSLHTLIIRHVSIGTVSGLFDEAA